MACPSPPNHNSLLTIFWSFALRWHQPHHRVGYFDRGPSGGHVSPLTSGFVAKNEHACVLHFIFVIDAELGANLLNVLCLPGEKVPARLRVVAFGILFERCWRVVC